MNIASINNFILAVFMLVVIMAFYVWKADTKNRLNIYYSVFCLIIASWIFFNYLWGFYQTSKILLTLTYLISPFIIITMFLWLNYLYSKTISVSLKIFLWISALAGGLLTIASFSNGNLLISDVKDRLIFTTGPIFSFFTAYFIILVIVFLIYYFYKYRKAPVNLKKPLAVMTSGILLSVLIGIMVSYVMPALGFVNLAIFDAPSSVFFIVLSAFAILKMQVFDLKIVLTEIITYFILILTFIILFLVKEDLNILIKVLFMFAFIYGGYHLVKSVKKEVSQKEKLQVLSKQLEQANAHLKELDAMKTEFVSLASHELLTPVSAIEGYLSMLLDEKMARVDDPKAKQYLDNVYASAKRLARLIADMLNISRIEEGRLSVEKKEVNIGDTIDQVIAEIRFKAEERKQKVVFNRDPQANYSTFADPDKIKEIVINIIGNSIKYSRDPGTVIVTVQKVPRQLIDSTWSKIEAEIKARPLDDQEAIKSAVDPHYRELVGEEQLMIAVKDQGVGIPREELPRLFKKFHRVGNYSTQESQGTGLGLYISRALVELQHGRIWADSEGEGKGSTFTFTLPELAVKDQIITLEKEIPMDKEQMKPLARPMKSAAEEL